MRFLVILCLVSTTTAFGQLPQARLSSIFPPGGKAGTTVEIAIAGQDLDGPSRMHFSHAGIAAAPKGAESSAEPDSNKFLITIGPEVPPGVYEARVIGRFGISNPRAFCVSDRSETTEEAARSSGGMIELPFDTIINARAGAGAIDQYKFKASQGQRILIRCQAKEIDSRMDPVLLLYDLAGRELERNRRGGLIDFSPPADGEYVMKVHDFLFRGGEDYFYRLSAGTGPHIDFVFPPAGQAGSKTSYVLYGRNLPGGSPADVRSSDGKPLEKLDVEIELPSGSQPQMMTSALVRPADSVLDGVEYRLRGPNGLSNPAFISIATASLITREREPNNTAASAQELTLPCEYVGQFFPRGDRDLVRFKAAKGEVYWVELFSQRLTLPTDPFVVIQRVAKTDQGEEKVSDIQELYDFDANVGGVEFNTATRDPAWRFEVKEDGLYQIQVADLFNRSHDNPALTYRLSMRKETPDFRLVALAPAPPPATRDQRPAQPWAAVVRRDETTPLKLLVLRRDNFDSDIQLSIEGLPPGVRCAETRIPAGQSSAWLMLTAESTVQDWAGPIRIVGRARVGDTEIMREARAGAVIWSVADYNNEPVQSRMTRNFVLSVIGNDAAPVRIAAVEDKVWETSVAAKLQIPLKIIRRGDFNGPIKVRAIGLPVLDSMKESEIPAKGESGNIELDLAQNKIPVGYHTIYLLAQTQGKHPRRSSEEIKTLEAELKVAEEEAKQAEKALADLSAAAKAPSDSKSSADDNDARTKETGKKKELAQARAKRIKEALEKARPKDTALTVYSGPIRLKVASAPIRISLGSPEMKIAPGGGQEILVSVQRLHGFDDTVELSLVLPSGAKGVRAAKITVPKEKNSATLRIDAEPTASQGDHKATIRAALKFNNQNLQADESLQLKITASEQAKKS